MVILCSLCHEYITSRFRMTDEFHVEAGTLPPPRPGLPPVEVHEDALPTGTAMPARPALPPADNSRPEAKPEGSPLPPRIRPF